ncbi:hypothetical protein Tco_0105291 [Tanacetum coccineum]
MQNKMVDLKKILLQRPQGSLPSNAKPNPREKVNSIMTRSGLTTAEPSISPPIPPTPRVVVEKEPETLMDEDDKEKLSDFKEFKGLVMWPLETTQKVEILGMEPFKTSFCCEDLVILRAPRMYDVLQLGSKTTIPSGESLVWLRRQQRMKLSMAQKIGALERVNSTGHLARRLRKETCQRTLRIVHIGFVWTVSVEECK